MFNFLRQQQKLIWYLVPGNGVFLKLMHKNVEAVVELGSGQRLKEFEDHDKKLKLP